MSNSALARLPMGLRSTGIDSRATMGLVAIAEAIFGTLLLALSWTTSALSFVLSCGLLCAGPIALVCLQRVIRGYPLFYFDFPLILALSFFVFFGVGVLSLDSTVGLRYAALGTIDREFIFQNLFWLSAISMIVVLPALLVKPVASIRAAHGERDSSKSAAIWRNRVNLLLLAEACLLLAFAGTLLTIVQAGSFGAAFDALSSHNKKTLEGLGTLPGQSLWQIFALPACVASEAVLLTRSRDRVWNVVLFQLLILLTTALFLYGSRLLFTLALISLAAIYSAAKGAAVKKGVLLGLSAFIIVSSIPVLAARTGVADEVDIRSVSSIVGYNIFDVSMASIAVRESLAARFADPSRFATAGSTVLPFVGPSSDEVNAIRLDVLVAQYIDGGNSDRGYSTGFPPSLPTALYVGYGAVGGLLAGLGFGLAAAWITFVLSRRVLSSRSSVALMFYGYAVVTVFNMFKDGDIAIGLAGALKTTFFVMLMVGSTHALIRSPKPRVRSL